MPETTIQEQIVREAPEIEAIKLGLLQSARTLADRPVTLPEQQIAGFSGLQQQAFDAATGPQGVGSYLPGLTAGTATDLVLWEPVWVLWEPDLAPSEPDWILWEPVWLLQQEL